MVWGTVHERELNARLLFGTFFVGGTVHECEVNVLLLFETDFFSGNTPRTQQNERFPSKTAVPKRDGGMGVPFFGIHPKTYQYCKNDLPKHVSMFPKHVSIS